MSSKRRRKPGAATKPWTSAGAAREARISTERYLRQAPLARESETARLVEAFQGKLAHLGNPVGSAQLRPGGDRARITKLPTSRELGGSWS